MSSTSSPPSPQSPPMKVRRTEDEANLEVVEVSSSSSPSPGPANNNPMLIDVVLDNLFGYCEFEDLANCRLVSQQWFNVSLRHWLEKAPMLALPFDSSLNLDYSQGVEKTMSRFLGVVHSEFHGYGPYEYAGLRKYKKFDIQGDAALSLHHQLLQHFLRNCGDHITDLKLELEFPDLETYRTVMLSSMTPNLVNLEANVSFSYRVDMDDGVYDFEEEEEEAHKKLRSLAIDCEQRESLPVIGWIQLFRRYPNLEKLVRGVDHSARARDVDRMLEAIWTIRKADKKLLDLKRLDVICDGTNYQLTSLLPLLRDTRLTLETFFFSIGDLTPAQTIYDVLNSQRGSLKTLYIYKETPLPETFEPPKLKSVESLLLHDYPVRNLRVLKAFPNLTHFDFLIYGRDNLRSIVRDTTEESLQEGGLVIPTLTSFQCEYGSVEGTLRPQDIRKLHSVMPNLTTLKLWLNNESFRAVCECWPRLEELWIDGNEVNDEGITGDVPGMETRNPHNITSLQGLKSLTMTHFDADYEDDMGPVAITHKSVSQLLTLPVLEELEMSLDSDMIENMDVTRAMYSKIKNCKITWIYNEGEDEGEERYSYDDDDDEIGESGENSNSEGDGADGNNDEGGEDDNDDDGEASPGVLPLSPRLSDDDDEEL